MKILLMLYFLFIVPKAKSSELEVYICGWYSYGYDCVLIVDNPIISFDEDLEEE